jgi:cell division protein FtsL
MPIEVHLEKRIINTKVVREADPKSHRDYLVVTVLASVFLLGLFVYAWQHYQWIQYGYRIEEAQKKKEQLAEAGRQLRLERATLRSPQRIDAIARRDLGMVVPSPGQLVTFSADSPLTNPSPAPELPVLPLDAEVAPQPAALTAKR